MWTVFSASLNGFVIALTVVAGSITIYDAYLKNKWLIQRVITAAIEDADRTYPQVRFAAAVVAEPKTSTFEVEIYEQLETSVSFENGEQFIDDDYRRSKIAFVAYRFVQRLRELGLADAPRVHAEFHGGADATGGTGEIGKYRGDYGDYIRVERPVLGNALSGERHGSSRVYRTGQEITNEDLALIRAYGMYRAFDQHIRGKGSVDSMQFRGSTSDQVGERFRFGKILITLTGGGLVS